MNWRANYGAAIVLFALGCSDPTATDPSPTIDSAGAGHNDVTSADGALTDVAAGGGGDGDALRHHDVLDVLDAVDVVDAADSHGGDGSDAAVDDAAQLGDITVGFDVSAAGDATDGGAAPTAGGDGDATEVSGDGGFTTAQADGDGDSQGAEDTSVVDGDATAPASDGTVSDGTASLASDVSSTACTISKELCDGLDNDCDGLTDEDFSITPPGSGTPLKIGQSCANPSCPGGKVHCDSVKYAWCDTCPKVVTLGAQLAPKGAKLSPLTATGGFVDVSGQLPLKTLVPIQGSPLYLPPGISGMALDVDNDGDLDLVWVHAEKTVTLLTQTAAWSYTATVVLQSKTAITCIAATDRDGDGVPELVIGGDGLTVLERKKDGSYTTSPVNSAFQLPQNNGNVQHITSADINGDGLLDLVVGLFSCNAKAQALHVYVNRGGHGYEEQSVALGLTLTSSTWAILASDYNGDGRLDLLVMTESCPPDTGIALYLGQPDPKPGASPSPRYLLAQQDGVFTAPMGPSMGSPMGAAAADVNGDGVLDYLLGEIELSSYEPSSSNPKPIDPLDPQFHDAVSNVYLLSQPGGKRARAGLEAGLWAPLSASGKTMVAWSSAWTDLDHDGHLDLLLAHGYEGGSWMVADQGGMRPVAFRHDGTGHFKDVSATWGLPPNHPTRAMVAADLDGDGDLDLVLGGQTVGVRVYRNDIKHGGGDVRVRLIGTSSNRWGLGAQVRLHTDQRVLLAEMGATAPAQTMATPAVHFALRPKELAEKVVVTWPTGWEGTTVLGATSGAGKAVLGKGGWVTLTEPAVVSLSTRWSPAGSTPVTITAVDRGPDGQPASGSKGCSIGFAGGATGAFAAATKCAGATCTRTWNGPGKAGSEIAFVITCGGGALSVRPRVFL